MLQQPILNIRKLPPLSRLSKSIPCKVCGAPSGLFDVVDFNKYCSTGNPYEFGVAGVPVTYYRCDCCELIFTDLIDNWAADEISSLIYNDDYILVDPEYAEARPRQIAEQMSEAMRGLESTRILDYGSGSGLFAAEMLSRGFRDVRAYDPFSAPNVPEGLFDIITCFEVIEHSPEPAKLFAEMTKFLKGDGVILIGQTLQPANIEEIRGAWWYIGPRNGHVSMFSNVTFSEIARRQNYSFRSGGNIYAFHPGSFQAQMPAMESLMNRIGPKYDGRVFLAPAQIRGASGEWHELEFCRTKPFRWTASQIVEFGAISIDCDRGGFKIPFLMESKPDFSHQCVIHLDGEPLPTRVEGSALVAECGALPPKSYDVSLVTPEPLTPRALNGMPDDRPLGLAVRSGNLPVIAAVNATHV